MTDTPNQTGTQPQRPVPGSQTARLVAGLCAAAFLAGLSVVTAHAQTTPASVTHTAAVATKPAEGNPTAQPAVASKPVSRLGGRYFVDFRSRTAASYGHAFVWYGRLTDSGKVGKIEVAGLHPASDSPIPYVLGHIIPVPAETGKSYGDLDEQYLTANYRVYLSEADAKKVFAYIQHKQASSPLWWNGVYNCTAFIADIASFMGLQTPPTATWMYPETMVNALRSVNHGRTEVALAAGR